MTDLRTEQATLKRKVKRYLDKCDYCGEATPEILQLHHIKPVAEGGNNSPNNLILLCPNCHIKAHKGIISPEALKKVASQGVYQKAVIEHKRLKLPKGCNWFTKINTPEKTEALKRKLNDFLKSNGSSYCGIIKNLKEKGIITTSVPNMVRRLNNGTISAIDVIAIYEAFGYKLNLVPLQN